MTNLSSKLLDGVFERLEDLLLTSNSARHTPVAVAANLGQGLHWKAVRDKSRIDILW